MSKIMRRLRSSRWLGFVRMDVEAKDEVSFVESDLEILSDDDTVTAVGSESVKEEMRITINRSYYTRSNFNADCNRVEAERQTAKEKLVRAARKYVAPSCDCFRKMALSFFPFIGIMRKYSVRDDLLSDIISGLTVGVMHIPQGLAYGMLANLEPVYGLYTSFFPVIVYFFLGTSLHISLGTFAVVSLMVGGVVQKSNCSSSNDGNFSNASATFNGSSGSSTNDPLMCKLQYAMALTMLVGIYQFFLGLFRIGFVTIYLSDPLTRALTSGASVLVFTAQLKYIFGVDTGQFSGSLQVVYTCIELFKNITGTNVASLVMSIICIVILYSLQRWVSPFVKLKLKVPFPAELLLLIVCTLISSLAKFSHEDVFKMRVVGDIPTGFPSPSFPRASLFPDVAVDAISIAIVGFAINISLAKLFAKKHSYSLDSNQELMAYGISNFASSMFSCFSNTAALARSAVQESAGGKTQVAGLVSCGLLMVVLLAVGPLFRELPNCILAVVIIVNLRGVFLQITDLPRLLKISVLDMMIWIVTFVAVVLTDVDIGLLIGVCFSLLTLIFKTQRFNTTILGRIPHTEIYEDTKAYQAAKEISMIKIFRFTASLCSVNAEYFVQKLYKKTGCNPATVKSTQKEFLRLLELQTTKPQVRSRLFRRHEPGISVVTPEFVTISEQDAAGQTVVPSEITSCDIKNFMPKANITNVIIDCSCMAFIDAMGITTLEQVIQEYRDVKVQVSLASCNDEVYELLGKTICNKMDEMEKETEKKEDAERLKFKIFVTVHDAVVAAIHDRKDVDAELMAEFGSAISHQQANGYASGNQQSQVLDVSSF